MIREIVTEVCVVLSWSEDARRAYNKALREYIKAGSPGIPLGARDYRKNFLRNKSKPKGDRSCR